LRQPISESRARALAARPNSPATGQVLCVEVLGLDARARVSSHRQRANNFGRGPLIC
jgi:hypothetical protein